MSPMRLWLVVALAACGGRSIVVNELTPRDARARPAESVEMYRNAPPARPFLVRATIDLSLPAPPEPEAIARYQEVGGTLGCDAVIVYTQDHPALRSLASAPEDQALALGMDGVLAWRAIGVTGPNRRAFYVQGPNSKTIVVDQPTVGLCLAFVAP